MEIRRSCASSVIVHRVPVNSVDCFIEWQRRISQVATSFPGYQTTDVYPPTEDGQLEWVVIIHFDTSEALQRWLHSVERSEWTAKLHGAIANFRIETLSTGFAPWFGGFVNKPEGTLPPAWKIALTVLLGLYPTVMLLTLLISPHLSWLGFALSMLISNALSVSILQWAVMPRLNTWLAPWLQANTNREKALSGGLVLILLLLGVLVGLFHWVMG